MTPQHQFKPDDIVICVDASFRENELQKGKAYLVRKVSNSHIYVHTSDEGWWPWRFKLLGATETEPKRVHPVIKRFRMRKRSYIALAITLLFLLISWSHIHYGDPPLSCWIGAVTLTGSLATFLIFIICYIDGE